MLYDEDLFLGDSDDLANYLGVSHATIMRWKKKPLSAPVPVRRLMRLRLDGDLGALLGKDWDGFYIQENKLHAPVFEAPMSAWQIKAMFFNVQELGAVRADLRELQARFMALQEKIESGGHRARLREYSSSLKALCEAIALEVRREGDSADQSQRDEVVSV